jgi:hypothetical protein
MSRCRAAAVIRKEHSTRILSSATGASAMRTALTAGWVRDQPVRR